MNTSRNQAAVSFDVLSTAVGELTLCCTESGALCEIAFDSRAIRARLTHAPQQLRAATQQLAEYFVGKRRSFDLELAPEGTRFQHSVWRVLAAIPYGESCSYSSIARQIGSPAASRAVGAANGKNPLPIVVPCHRVVGSNGALTGYAGGLPIKRFLLNLELSNIASARATDPHLAASAALHPES